MTKLARNALTGMPWCGCQEIDKWLHYFTEASLPGIQEPRKSKYTSPILPSLLWHDVAKGFSDMKRIPT
jgi:hypothetical protein